MNILIKFIFLLILTSSFAYANETEQNYFCKKEFRSGNNYSLKLLKQKIAEGLNVNNKCTHTKGHGLDYIVKNIKEPEALQILKNAGANFKAIRKSHAGITGDTLLHIAAKGHLAETINFLVKIGYDINAKNKWGDTPMSYGCKHGSVKILKSLINNKANYKYKNYTKKENKSCLIEATQFHNNFESIKYLYSIDTPKDLPKCTHFRSINCSSFSKIYLNYGLLYRPDKYDFRVLKFFNQNGENLNQYFKKSSYTNTYTTILHQILRTRPIPIKVKIVEDLLKLGVDVNQPEVYKTDTIQRIEQSPIFSLFHSPLTILEPQYDNILSLINLLVKSGANLNYVSEDRYNSLLLEGPLLIREQEFRHKVINELVSKGLDINKRDNVGENILFKASDLRSNSKDFFIDHAFLISLGAEYSLRNESARTLLHNWSYENHPKLVEKYIELGIDVNSKDYDGRSPLLINLSHPNYFNINPEREEVKRLQVIKTLLTAGSKIDARDINGNGIYHYAAMNHHSIKILKYLNKYNVEIDMQNYEKLTPIMAFLSKKCYFITTKSFQKCIKNKYEGIKFFVSNGANINHRDSRGYNSLHLAAKFSRSPEIVLYLLEKRADHKARTEEGKTALDLIKNNDSLYDSVARWKLHDLSFD